MRIRIPKKTLNEIDGLIFSRLCAVAQGQVAKGTILDQLAHDPAIGGRIGSYTGPKNIKAFIARHLMAPRLTAGKSYFQRLRTPDPLTELQGLIGLETVKDQVTKTANLINLSRERNKAGLPRLDITHHLVFTGNPGTGKTTVARLVGRIYKDLGVLKSGHMVETDRGDLVAPYVGQTALRVKEVVAQAMDGVLFIDEAYSLAPSGLPSNDFGAEAIQALIKLMEDERGRLVVIIAGYTEEMKRLISSNPGLASRFKTVIDFADYGGGDLFKILNYMCETAGCRLSTAAMIEAAALMGALRTGEGFGNARTVRNIFEECLARQGSRLMTAGRGKVNVRVLEVQDIPKPEELSTLMAGVKNNQKSTFS